MKIGDTFDRYVVEELVGRGGMGEVYKAFDPKLNRRVALKILRRDDDGTLPHPEATARLIREARTAAALVHPNVVAIHDVGERDGIPFLAMEFVVGRSIRELMGSASLATRIGWMIEVARALGAAHAAGLVHRDIKPENVMVRSDGLVKVLDFGIARQTTAGVDPTAKTVANGVATITQQGVLVGTPAYMSPEQLRGESLDGRSDQFAWGVMFYEVVAGRLPWGSAQDQIQVISAVLTRNPETLRALEPQLTDNIDLVVLRALSKAPQDRFASMQDAIAALSSDTAPKVFASPSRGEPARANRWKIGAVALAIVVGLAAGAFAIRRRPSSPQDTTRPQPSAVLRSEVVIGRSKNAQAQAAYEEGLKRWKQGRPCLDQVERAIELDPWFASANMFAALQIAHREPVRTRKYFAAAMSHRQDLNDAAKGLLDAFEPVFGSDQPDWQTVEDRLSALSERYPSDALILYLRAWACMSRDRLREGRELARRAAEVDPDLAQAWRLLGVLDADASDLEAARTHLQECIRASEGGARCMVPLAEMEAAGGECKKSEMLARRIIAASPDSAEGYTALASISLALGMPAAAIDEVHRQKWSRLPTASRARTEAEDNLAMALAFGDLPQALSRAQELQQALVSTPDEMLHAKWARAVVQILTEMGKTKEASQTAETFLARRQAWMPTLQVRGSDGDVVPLMFEAMFRAGSISGAKYQRERDEHLATWRAKLLTRELDGSLWLALFAAPVGTPKEAQDAVAALESKLPTFHWDIAPSTDEGRVRYLTGQHGLAQSALERAAHHCGVLSDPIAHVRAHYWLGMAYEATQQPTKACVAYQVVLQRWGKAVGTSTTARAAKQRAESLKCTVSDGR